MQSKSRLVTLGRAYDSSRVTAFSHPQNSVQLQRVRFYKGSLSCSWKHGTLTPISCTSSYTNPRILKLATR